MGSQWSCFRSMSIQSNQSQPYCLEMWENAILDNFYNFLYIPCLISLFEFETLETFLGQAFKLLYVSLFIAASSKFSVVLQVLLQRSQILSTLSPCTNSLNLYFALQEVTGPLPWCYWDVRQVDAVSRYLSWPWEILEILTTTFQEYWPVHPPHFTQSLQDGLQAS